MLLISGGEKDTNLTHLADACVRYGCPAFTLYLDEPEKWDVRWSLDEPSKIYINDQCITPKAVFVRWDAFSFLDPTADSPAVEVLNNWFDLIKGWALANPSVRLLNRFHNDHLSNKPYLLLLAKDCGLDVPETYFSNDAKPFTSEKYIIKPVSGGSHTMALSDDIDLAYPAIVQEKLINPEVRIYRVGDHFFAFQIESPALDYRSLDIDDVSIQKIEPQAGLVEGLRKLTDHLKLDYAAADFKTCPESGELKFLEINSMPMFAGFDYAGEGDIVKAILAQLMPGAFPSLNKLEFSGAS